MTCSPQLRPVRREEIIDTLVYAICSDPRRGVSQPGDELVARATAERLARHLRIAGYLIAKKTALPCPLDYDED
jgi:hypothetical protein